jgi:hypothetical protein
MLLKMIFLKHAFLLIKGTVSDEIPFNEKTEGRKSRDTVSLKQFVF